MMLAIPMVLEMIMESVFAVVDVFFVARLGANAVATVGLTVLLTLIYTLAVGLSIGASAMVARRIGEQDYQGGTGRGTDSSPGSFHIGGLGVVGSIFAPELLGLMGASPEVVAYGSGYTRVLLGGNIVIIMLFLVNAIFRGAGDGAIAMRALWLANGINILLCPCFIMGLGPFPELGVMGASVATTIGRGTGALYVLSRLFRGNGQVKLSLSHLKVNTNVMATLVKLSSSGMFQVFIGMASWIGLMRILSSYGSTAIAGYTIGIRIILFALFPSFGMSNAAATMVGQALGAGKPDRAEKAVWLTGFYNMCFLGAIGLFFVVLTLAGEFLQLRPEVIAYATDCLRTVACGFLFYAYGMVITQSFNGANGDTGLRRGSTSVCLALRDPACLRPCQRTRNRALGYFPGHHDRVPRSPW